MKFNVIGANIFSTSGFSQHTRALANSLHELGHDVRLQCPLPENWIRMVNDAEMLMLQREMTRDRITIFIGHPQYLPLAWNDSDNVIPFVVWEGNKIPAYWVKYLSDERIKLIFVPSKHVKEAIIVTALEQCGRDTFYEAGIGKTWLDKIKIVPHGVDLSIFNPDNLPKEPRDNFRFVANKGWNQGDKDRGGIQFLLQAYHSEFTKADKVELCIKLNPAYLTQGWNFDNELQKIGIVRDENSPLLRVSLDNVEMKEMVKFYNGDVFVSPSMGEAFNIPGLEAHAVGLPTIQTKFGGQLDYMKPEIDFYIDYQLIENNWDVMYEGVMWANPNITYLRKLMRYCTENRSECKEKGKLAIENAKQFTWKNTALKIIEEIEKIK